MRQHAQVVEGKHGPSRVQLYEESRGSRQIPMKRTTNELPSSDHLVSPEGHLYNTKTNTPIDKSDYKLDGKNNMYHDQYQNLTHNFSTMQMHKFKKTGKSK